MLTRKMLVICAWAGDDYSCYYVWRVAGTYMYIFTILGGKEMSVGIRPLGARVLIKKIEVEETTDAGFILTNANKKAPQQAEVIAVGNGTKDEPMELKVGETVIFSQYGGNDVEYDGEEYTLMNQSDILAVIE